MFIWPTNRSRNGEEWLTDVLFFYRTITCFVMETFWECLTVELKSTDLHYCLLPFLLYKKSVHILVMALFKVTESDSCS